MTPQPSPSLTDDQKEEWFYIFRERIGALCEDRMPTAWELRTAKADADEAVREQTELTL